MASNNHLIIMAGGIGSRFWPMSTTQKPKQFLDILGVGKSLLQLTVDRFVGLIPIENIWVVTSKSYRSLIEEQIPNIPANQILLEPCMRNTAPCIAYVSHKIKKRYPQANLVFSPADHIIIDTENFKNVIAQCLDFTAESNSIVTLGVQPSRAETGYGYIKAEQGDGMIRKVKAFKEKPNEELAQLYINEGDYYWNSGIFIWNVITVINELKCHTPELAQRFEMLSDDMFTEYEQAKIDREFPACESISIDYAVMEKSLNTFVYPANFGWSDLGTWGSLHKHLEKDGAHNTVVGNDIKLIDCEDCIIHTPEELKVVIQGLKDYIIAEKNNTLLICRKEDEQLIKQWQ